MLIITKRYVHIAMMKLRIESGFTIDSKLSSYPSTEFTTDNEPKVILLIHVNYFCPGTDPGGPRGPAPPTTKNEAPAPKFYKIEAPEWQF